MEKLFLRGLALEQEWFLCSRELIMEKAPCKGISLWKMVYVKGLNGRGLALEQEWFLYGKGPL